MIDRRNRYLRSGLKSVIIRRQLGNCCDFCAGLVGVYDYGSNNFPADIFVRHRDCRCLVSVKTEKGGYEDVWSKKEFSSQRSARKERLEEISEQDQNIHSKHRKINIAKDQGKKFADLTEYYNKSPKEYPAYVRDSTSIFEWDGKAYGNKPEHRITFDPSNNERRVAELIRDKFGGKIVLMPRVDFPKGIKVSDYFINDNVKVDLKTLKEWGKDPILRLAKKAKKQAEHVVIDISAFPEKQDECISQAREIVSRNDTKFIDTIALVNGNDFVCILEKIK